MSARITSLAVRLTLYVYTLHIVSHTTVLVPSAT